MHRHCARTVLGLRSLCSLCISLFCQFLLYGQGMCVEELSPLFTQCFFFKLGSNEFFQICSVKYNGTITTVCFEYKTFFMNSNAKIICCYTITDPSWCHLLTATKGLFHLPGLQQMGGSQPPQQTFLLL